MSDNNTKKEENVSFKIILLGDSTVGKTSLILRFCENKFENESIATIGIDNKCKYLKRDNKRIELKIWDTAGQERFKSIAKNSYKGADGILLMYDISNKKSFANVKKWIEDIKESIDITKIGFIVVANKCDLDKEEWQVDEEMKNKLEEKYNVKIMNTSCKNNTNIDETFANLVDIMLKLGIGKKSFGNEEEDDDENNDQNNDRNKSMALDNKRTKKGGGSCCKNK